MQRTLPGRLATSRRRMAALVLLGLLLAAPAGAAGSDTVTGLRVLTPQEYERASRADWEGIADKTGATRQSADALDRFIQRYPTSALSVVAFHVRFEQTRAAGTIEGWNAFISAHPRRAASFQAVHEVYQLYRRIDRIGGYWDFIRRYPNSPHALVAKARMEALSFELCAHLKKTDAFDGFVRMYPDAPQVPAAVQLARETMLLEEKRVPAAQREARAGRLFSVYAETIQSMDPDNPEPVDLYRSVRIRQVLREVYSGTQAVNHLNSATVTAAKLDQIRRKLGDIQTTLDRNHQQMVQTLRQEFSLTRETMQRGFQMLHRDNAQVRQSLDRGFAVVGQQLDQLHSDMQRIDQSVRNLHGTLVTVQNLVAQGNQQLAQLDGNLTRLGGAMVAVNDSIGDLQRDMNVNARRQLSATQDLSQHVVQGFSRQLEVSKQQLQVSSVTLQRTEQILDVGRKQLSVSTANLEANRGQLQEARQLRSQQATQHVATLGMLHRIKRGQDAGFKMLNNTMGQGFGRMEVGFARLEHAQWASTASLGKSINKSINKLGKQISQSQQQASGGGGGLFGKIAGGLTSFIPGGSLIAPAVESFTNGVVSGKSLGESVSGAAGKLADSYLPGSGALVESLASSFKQESNQTLMETAGMFAQAYDVPAKAFAGIAQATTPAALSKGLGAALAKNGVPAEAFEFAAQHL